MTATTLRITSLPAASVDIGDCGMPGSGASQIKCDIYARRDGRWDATGYYSTGCNQGRYQENYGYGPWHGRGGSPADAVDDMVQRADDEYQDDMRRAGHDALLECEGDTFASLATVEANRIDNILRNGERADCTFALIAGERHYVDAAERMALRAEAVRVLRGLTDVLTVTLERSADSGYTATISDRPGCVSEGQSVSETLRNLAEAIELYDAA